MPISDRDDINHRELARILGITAVAALKGGHFSRRQQQRIDQILDRAHQRETSKRHNNQ